MTQVNDHASRITHYAPRTIWVLLALVLVLTACLRWVRFGSFPPGLWYNEAYTLTQAQKLVQGGQFRIYNPEKHGAPAIFILLLFLAVRDVMRQESDHADWLALGSAAALGINDDYLFHSRISWQGALVSTTFIFVGWDKALVGTVTVNEK